VPTRWLQHLTPFGTPPPMRRIRLTLFHDGSSTAGTEINTS